jgi:hypothetical protein
MFNGGKTTRLGTVTREAFDSQTDELGAVVGDAELYVARKIM